MALIDCTECGNKISSLARSCPKCGHPQIAEVKVQPLTPAAAPEASIIKKPRGIFYYIAAAIILLVVLFFGSAVISALFDERAQKDGPNGPNGIHASDVVTMKERSYGCESLSGLTEAVEHRSADELAAYAKIANDEPACFYGGNLKSKQKWTVLQVNDNVMQISLSTVSQAQTDMGRSGHNYWTLVEWGMKEKPE